MNEPCLLPVLQNGCLLLSPTLVTPYCKGSIVSAASLHTPLALICEELLFSQVSFIRCIWCDT